MMSKVNGTLERAEQHCQQNGLRLTAKRKHVLAGLIQSNKALSAYELIEIIKLQYGESMPATSVYRILEFFENEHLVHKLNLANKYIACSHFGCNQEHDASQFLICSNCYKVEEISTPASITSTLQSNINQVGFQLTNNQIEMNCLRKNCLTQQI